MTQAFDPEYMADYFDRYGEAEWARHERSPSARVAFAVHCAFLRDHVRPGDLVLEAGAGAGRYTVELARLGAQFVSFEVRLCREPGVLDGGTHLLAAVRSPEAVAP